MANIARERDSFARGQWLFERVNGIDVARRRTDHVEWPVKLQVRDRLPGVRNVDLSNRLPRLVLQRHAHASVKRSPLGINIDRRVYCRDFRLQQVFILLELPFVIGLYAATRLGIEILIQYVGVVVIASPGTRSDQKEQHCNRRHSRRQPQSLSRTRTERILRTAARDGDRYHRKNSHNGEPINNPPEQRRYKMAVAIHVG